MSQFAKLPQLRSSVFLMFAFVTFAVPEVLASVPRAQCRPGDRTETGLQGQTTRADIDRGDSRLGFNCNADLIGQYQGEGAS